MFPVLPIRGGNQGVNLTSFLDSLYTVSYYLPIHSKVLKAIVKGIKDKNIKSAILQNQFDPQREGQVEKLNSLLDSLHMVSCDFSIQFRTLKAIIKETKKEKHKIWDFMILCLTHNRGPGGKFDHVVDSLQYVFQSPPNTFYGSKCNR